MIQSLLTSCVNKKQEEYMVAPHLDSEVNMHVCEYKSIQTLVMQTKNEWDQYITMRYNYMCVSVQ